MNKTIEVLKTTIEDQVRTFFDNIERRAIEKFDEIGYEVKTSGSVKHESLYLSRTLKLEDDNSHMIVKIQLIFEDFKFRIYNDKTGSVAHKEKSVLYDLLDYIDNTLEAFNS